MSQFSGNRAQSDMAEPRRRCEGLAASAFDAIAL
jgi:hypothetical protein